MTENWKIKGDFVLSCNCTVFCPCVISLGQHEPTEGRCQGWAGVQIDEGFHDDTDLTGVKAGLLLDIPGPLARGNWTAALYVDDKASIYAVKALTRIFSGKAGGSTGLLKILVGSFLGVRTEPILYDIKDGTHIFQIPKIIEGVVKPIRGKEPGQNVVDQQHRLLDRPATSPSRSAETSRVRAFGRNWNFEGRSAELVRLDWGSDVRRDEPMAFSVHIFTASGAALALLALLAATRADWTMMFVWLGVALFVDGVDGMFARALNVKERLPRWSGETLDLVVDFTTYVFVPAYAIATGNLLPPAFALPAAILIVVTGAIYFADGNMKTADNYFSGFPGVWNVPAFYLFLLRPDPWIALATVAVLAVVTFVPIPFVHPFRVEQGRIVTYVLLAGWAVLATLALLRDMMPGLPVTLGLCAIALYFLCAGLLRPHSRGASDVRPPRTTPMPGRRWSR